MFEDVLKYGREVIKDRCIDIPYNILSKFDDIRNQVLFKRELAEHGFRESLPVEEVSLDQAMELMKAAENDAIFVFYTLNYIAIRNPYIHDNMIDFLKGC